MACLSESKMKVMAKVMKKADGKGGPDRSKLTVGAQSSEKLPKTKRVPQKTFSMALEADRAKRAADAANSPIGLAKETIKGLPVATKKIGESINKITGGPKNIKYPLIGGGIGALVGGIPGAIVGAAAGDVAAIIKELKSRKKKKQSGTTDVEVTQTK